MPILLLLTAGLLSAQRPPAAQVPEAVLTAFHRAFPTVTHAAWKQQARTYSVRFTQAPKLLGKATFTPTGALVERQEEVPYSQLPPLARTAITEQFPHRHLDRIFRVLPATGESRYAVLVCPGTDKRGKDKDCETTLFDENGRRLGR